MVDQRPINTTSESIKALRTYLESVFGDMLERLEHQRDAVRLCLDRWEVESTTASAGGAPLVAAVRETVDVLEETKRSFKSKRLGELREKLERVLAEAEKN